MMSRQALFWRGMILLLWLVALALLLSRDFLVEELEVRADAALERDRETTFAGVYLQEQRIGFVRSRLTPEPAADRLRLQQEAFLRLNIMGEQQPVRLELTALLSGAYELRSFEFKLHSPLAATEASGRIADQELLLELTTPQGTQRQRHQLAAIPRIATPHRGYLLAQQPVVGSRLRLSYFDPVSLDARARVLEYRGRERVVIGGRVHNLHRFHETVSGMRISTWLDDQGRVIKEESPAGFVFLAEPEFRATDIPGGPELLTTVAVPLQGELPADLPQREEITFTLRLADGGGAELWPQLDLAGGRQQLIDNRLTIRRQDWPPEPAAAVAPCAEQEAALAATTHIQSQAPEIVATAAEITDSAQDAADKLTALTAWVYENLEQRPVLGIPDARSVLANRVGDCNEHAVLLAALARAAGLPTRLAAGLLYYQGSFMYHAWNEVCIAGEWISADATINQIPAPLTHIRLVAGDTQEMVRVGALLGRLQLALP